MTVLQKRLVGSLVGVLIMLAAAATTGAQVGAGLLDVNVGGEKELLALPASSPALVKAIVARRPFMSIVDLNTFLLAQKLTQAQANEIYKTAFIHVNLNTGTSDEILLIPGAGARMAREFAEYRPWRNWAHFDKEISKYVGQDEVNRLKKYVFIPVNLNTASDQDILSIPGAGQRMVREFKEYRPWKAKAQFEKEIGKYVGAAEVARLWRYVTIQ